MAICCPYCEGMCEGCDWCNETGVCCPRCRGAGFLARHRRSQGSALERCPVCQIDMSSGVGYDAVRAMQAVDTYIEDWFAGRVFDEVESRRQEQERVRQETEAARPARGMVWKHG